MLSVGNVKFPQDYSNKDLSRRSSSCHEELGRRNEAESKDAVEQRSRWISASYAMADQGQCPRGLTVCNKRENAEKSMTRIYSAVIINKTIKTKTTKWKNFEAKAIDSTIGS